MPTITLDGVELKVPQNCKYFRKFHGKWNFMCESVWATIEWLMKGKDDYWRGIVCSVAHTYWTMESKRCELEYARHGRNMINMLEDARQARINATAWLAILEKE